MIAAAVELIDGWMNGWMEKEGRASGKVTLQRADRWVMTTQHNVIYITLPGLWLLQGMCLLCYWLPACRGLCECLVIGLRCCSRNPNQNHKNHSAHVLYLETSIWCLLLFSSLNPFPLSLHPPHTCAVGLIQSIQSVCTASSHWLDSKPFIEL